MKNKQPTLFLDLSHDLAWRISFPLNWVNIALLASFPHKTTKQTQLQFSACFILPECVCVCGHESESLWSRRTHTLSTAYATGRHWESPRPSVSSSLCRRAPVSRPAFTLLHISADEWRENWSSVRTTANPLRKQLRTQKRQQVNIQHIKTPRYSF